jgi:3-hydroxybutyryl-CoA dehydratase
VIKLKTINFLVTEQDVEAYANISGDFNPIHLDEKHAQQQGFTTKIAHGMLTMAKIWSVLSNELLSTRMLPSQYDISFLNPVYVGDQVTLHVTKKENKIQLEGKSSDKTVVKGTILLQNFTID